MLSFATVRRVFIARQPQDMRRGIDTLTSVVVSDLGQDPYTGDCFVFLGRDRRRLKALVWEEGGFWLCLKRLEAGTFADPARWCRADQSSVAVTPAEMHALLEGIDVRSARYRVRQGYRVGEQKKFVKCRRGRTDDARGDGGADGRRHRAAARGAGAESGGAG